MPLLRPTFLMMIMLNQDNLSQWKTSKVQSLCKEIDDEMRWLIALISDTGMRLGETAGLLKEDIKLDEPIPYVDLKPHPWRTLKTKGSQRLIPLTKEALWASKRLLEANNDSIFAFPDAVMKQAVKLTQQVVD